MERITTPEKENLFNFTNLPAKENTTAFTIMLVPEKEKELIPILTYTLPVPGKDNHFMVGRFGDSAMDIIASEQRARAAREGLEIDDFKTTVPAEKAIG